MTVTTITDQKRSTKTLRFTKRATPCDADGKAISPFLHMSRFLETNPSSVAQYMSALRLLADWLQYNNLCGYTIDTPWPLNPETITNEVLLDFVDFLLVGSLRYAMNTVNTYLAAISVYLRTLEFEKQLPSGIELSRLQRHLRIKRGSRAEYSGAALDRSAMREEAIPRIAVHYRDTPLPLFLDSTYPDSMKRNNDIRRKRLILLRDRTLR